MNVDIVIRSVGLPTQKKYVIAKKLNIEKNDNILLPTTSNLDYCIKFIKRNLPWVNKIFIIIGDNETLQKKFNKYNIIKHSEFIPKKYLPTYNSNVVDSYIYKIPGLSEKFLMVDDDLYAIKSMKYEDFFSNDKPIIRLNIGRNNITKTASKYNLYNKMWYDGLKKYKFTYSRPSQQIQPILKSKMLEYKRDFFNKDLITTSKNKLRSKNDINLLRFTEVMMIKDNYAEFIKSNDTFFESSDILNLKNIKKSHLMCINNSYNKDKHVYAFLKKLYELNL
jgi:hypothetical protein